MKAANKMTTSDFKKKISSKKHQDLSIDFLYALKIFGDESTNGYTQEQRFHPTRKWRFDFAWLGSRVAVECDGIIFKACGGRHNTDEDREKINTAVCMGWRVLRFSGKQIKNDPFGCVEMLKKCLLTRHV
jgi:very-short-patch-repair endonuclease